MPIITVPFPIGCTSPPSTCALPQSVSAPPSQIGKSADAKIGWKRYTVSMSIDSGLRAGLVIGLMVTPSKIQHDGSRWKRKLGRGGSNMLSASADSQTRPRSRRTSSFVMPPIRKSAASVWEASSSHSRARRGGTDADLELAEDVLAHPGLRLGRLECLGQQGLDLEHLDAPFAHHLAEGVVLLLRLAHPEHVVEQQLLGIGRREPFVLEAGSVDHDPAQRADFGMNAECHGDSPQGFEGTVTTPSTSVAMRVPASPTTRRSMSAERADDGRFAGDPGEVAGGDDLREHGACGELGSVSGEELVRVCGDDLLLVGRAEADEGSGRVGGHDEDVRPDVAGEQPAGVVLVDHRLDADETRIAIF